MRSVAGVGSRAHQKRAAAESSAAEGAQGDAALVVAVEGHTHEFQLYDALRSLAAEDIGGVLVSQVIAALDGIEGVLFRGIVCAQGGIDSPLGGCGVAANGMYLGDYGDIGAFAVGFQGGSHAGQPGADDNYVMFGQ